MEDYLTNGLQQSFAAGPPLPLFLYDHDDRRELKVFEDLLRSMISLLTVICSRT